MASNSLVQLGDSELWVSRVALGCWPFSGVSSLDIDDRDSVATVRAALEAGINFFDTAYSYGYDGRSDRVLVEGLGSDRQGVIIATKVGTHYDSSRNRVVDGRPETIIAHADELLTRLQTERIDLLYLHQPDPQVAIERSAEAFSRLVDMGKIRYVGISNATVDQAERFSAICPVIAHQPPFNMLQPETVDDLLPWCRRTGIGLVVYWALMKGLLGGKFPRDHQFDPRDRRLSYPMYSGVQWQRNQDLLDGLRAIAAELSVSVAELVTRWTMEQPCIASVLVGARRPDQILETARSPAIAWSPEIFSRVDRLVSQRRLQESPTT